MASVGYGLASSATLCRLSNYLGTAGADSTVWSTHGRTPTRGHVLFNQLFFICKTVENAVKQLNGGHSWADRFLEEYPQGNTCELVAKWAAGAARLTTGRPTDIPTQPMPEHHSIARHDPPAIRTASNISHKCPRADQHKYGPPNLSPAAATHTNQRPHTLTRPHRLRNKTNPAKPHSSLQLAPRDSRNRLAYGCAECLWARVQGEEGTARI